MLRSAAAMRVATRSGTLMAGSARSVAASRASPFRLAGGTVFAGASQRPSYLRAFASQQNRQDEAKRDASDGGKAKEQQEDENAIVLTPGEKVVAASRLGMWAGILAFALACGYYIVRELIPTKMSPNSVFNGAIELIRNNPQVRRQYGDKLRMYGKDHGGHREGRRNFIEHTQYMSPDDNSNRTRVRFNLEGQFASAFCFAEVSSDLPSGEFVYVLVQDKQTGRVITVVDNRAAMTAARLSGGNKQTSQAMQQLLGGSGDNKSA